MVILFPMVGLQFCLSLAASSDPKYSGAVLCWFKVRLAKSLYILSRTAQKN
jgi:hypothetical protein